MTACVLENSFLEEIMRKHKILNGDMSNVAPSNLWRLQSCADAIYCVDLCTENHPFMHVGFKINIWSVAIREFSPLLTRIIQKNSHALDTAGFTPPFYVEYSWVFMILGVWDEILFVLFHIISVWFHITFLFSGESPPQIQDPNTCFVNRNNDFWISNLYQEQNDRLFFIFPSSSLQYSCCQPPLHCGFANTNDTYWEVPKSGILSEDPDCQSWRNDLDQVCYDCNSCKAGYIRTLKNEWSEDATLKAANSGCMFIGFLIAFWAFRQAPMEDHHHHTANNVSAAWTIMHL